MTFREAREGRELPLYIIKESLVQSCGGCPTQWDADTPSGEKVFVHYRNGGLSVFIDGECIHSINHGNSAEGIIEWKKVLQLTGMKMVRKEAALIRKDVRAWQEDVMLYSYHDPERPSFQKILSWGEKAIPVLLKMNYEEKGWFCRFLEMLVEQPPKYPPFEQKGAFVALNLNTIQSVWDDWAARNGYYL